MSRQARPVSVSLTTGALVSLPLLMLASIVLSWLVTDHAVHAALAQYPSERYFIEAYQSSAHAVFLLGAVLALAIAIAVPERLRLGPPRRVAELALHAPAGACSHPQE